MKFSTRALGDSSLGLPTNFLSRGPAGHAPLCRASQAITCGAHAFCFLHVWRCILHVWRAMHRRPQCMAQACGARALPALLVHCQGARAHACVLARSAAGSSPLPHLRPRPLVDAVVDGHHHGHVLGLGAPTLRGHTTNNNSIGPGHANPSVRGMSLSAHRTHARVPCAHLAPHGVVKHGLGRVHPHRGLRAIPCAHTVEASERTRGPARPSPASHEGNE